MIQFDKGNISINTSSLIKKILLTISPINTVLTISKIILKLLSYGLVFTAGWYLEKVIN